MPFQVFYIIACYVSYLFARKFITWGVIKCTEQTTFITLFLFVASSFLLFPIVISKTFVLCRAFFFPPAERSDGDASSNINSIRRLRKFQSVVIMFVAFVGIVGCLASTTRASVADAWVEEGLDLRRFRSGMEQPRGLFPLPYGDILVVQRKTKGAENIAVMWDDNGDGEADDVVPIFFPPGNANHGLVVHKGYVYASSDTTVWRWKWVPGQRAEGPNSRKHQEVITNINKGGNGGAARGHRTRSLVFDGNDRLYVSVGSVGNVDRDSYRSRIRRCDMSFFSDDSPPFDFTELEVFADGVRNEVGLAFDANGTLWGVENGADNLKRSDLGGDIHNDNPAEELNRFPEENAGMYYGYPNCWTEYKLPPSKGKGRGTAWKWPGKSKTDAWCQNPSNVVPPAVAMQAHSAPLGIDFYKGVTPHKNCTEKRPYAMPEKYIGDAFVAFHGSWNRDTPTGYKIVRIPMDDHGMPVDGVSTEPVDLVRHKGLGAKWPTNVRFVDVKFDACGRLWTSSDKNDEVYVLGSLAPPPTRAPTGYPTLNSTADKSNSSEDGSNVTAAPSQSPSLSPTTFDPTSSPSSATRSPAVDNPRVRVHAPIAASIAAAFCLFVAGVAMIARERR